MDRLNLYAKVAAEMRQRGSGERGEGGKKAGARSAAPPPKPYEAMLVESEYHKRQETTPSYLEKLQILVSEEQVEA